MRKSIKPSISLRPDGNYSVIKHTLGHQKAVFSHFEKEADLLGRFTAVDGATIVTKDFDIIAIGAKIRELEGPPDIKNNPLKPWIQQPYEGCEPNEKPEGLSALGGTRHQSAAQFVYAHRTETVFAIVASQDGKISIIYWDEKKERLISFIHAEYSYRGIKYS